jgi:hypothetical protein
VDLDLDLDVDLGRCVLCDENKNVQDEVHVEVHDQVYVLVHLEYGM